MLVTISPAKKLDWSEPPALPLAATEPEFAAGAVALAGEARALGAGGLARLMGISDRLAQLNQQRFEAFSAAPAPQMLRPAGFAFAGDTYVGLDMRSLDSDALRWAQDHLRILSGLYGLLRPLDRIQPYRLEMGSRLANARGGSLYDYWKTDLAVALGRAAQAAGASVLLNCASVEYFSAVDTRALGLRVITPVFMEERDGTRKVISFFAKRARGAMARFVMENRITEQAALAEFDLGGYRHRPDLGTADRPVFLRDAA